MNEALGDEGAEVEPGPEGGEAGGETEQFEGGGEQQPARQYVEVDDPDQRFVRVKVDGQDLEVPLSEALRGYSREADYTRKTQDLAQQRQAAEFGLQLQRALEADPQTTLRILADRYQQQQQQAPVEEPTYDDPLERMLHEERNARLALEARISQREADEQLNSTIQGLRQSFGATDEDIQVAVNVAYQQKLDITALPMIYKTIAFDRIQAAFAAQRQTDQQRAATEAQRTAAKAAQAGVIGSGTGVGNGLSQSAPNTGTMSIREAAEAAFEQHGMPTL